MNHLLAKLKLQRQNFKLDVSLNIKKGEITALYGASASGKSTILKIIAGLDTAASGSTIVSDDQVWLDDTRNLATHLRGVGYVSQHSHLLPHLSVRDNLAFASKRRHNKNAASLNEIKSWLGLEDLVDKAIHELSGGEKQKISIACVLLNGARILLMDEPLAALDTQTRQNILPFIDQLHERLDFPFLYVSHDLHEINYLADKVYIIESGHITHTGTPFDLTPVLSTMDKNPNVILRCQVNKFDSDYQLTELSIGHQKLFIQGDKSHQQSIKIRIPAREVSITIKDDEHSSILNRLHGEIATIDVVDNTALIAIDVSGQQVLAQVTRRSLDRLGLHKGQTVIAQIKSVSLNSQYEY